MNSETCVYSSQVAEPFQEQLATLLHAKLHSKRRLPIIQTVPRLNRIENEAVATSSQMAFPAHSLFLCYSCRQ